MIQRLRHVGALVRAAWRSRDRQPAPREGSRDLVFLPEYVRLLHSPLSPTLRWTMRIMAGLAGAALLWASFGTVDIVAVAPGQLVVGSRSKVVQPTDAGVVARIRVRDGQVVRKGQVLIELDRAQTRASRQRTVDALLDAELSVMRLTALTQALENNVPLEIPDFSDHLARRHSVEAALTDSQYAAYQAHFATLEASIHKHRAELSRIQDLAAFMTESVRIAQERANDFRQLVGERYVARHEYLLREQERIGAERELRGFRHRETEARAALRAAEATLDAFVNDTRRTLLLELRQSMAEVVQLRTALGLVRSEDARMTLRAPSDGTVQEMSVHTIGGVVSAGQPLLVIVPREQLEVDAHVLNRDIGFVRRNQPVMIKVDSFPYTRYGYLTGKIVSISEDAVIDERLGAVYPARIRLDREPSGRSGLRLPVRSGMTASVEIRTGERRMIEYLLSPVLRYQHEALRER